MAVQPFDWSKYFELAGTLGKSTDHASLRTSISRAYYYVFHLARARAVKNGYKHQTGTNTGSHKQLWQAYESCPEPDAIRLHEIALRMKKNRERADYEDSFARIADEVPAALKDAQNFDIILKRLPARLPAVR